MKQWRTKIPYFIHRAVIKFVPPNTAVLGTGEKPAVFRKQQYWESYITYKTLFGTYGIGREGVLGGVVLGGTTVV